VLRSDRLPGILGGDFLKPAILRDATTQSLLDVLCRKLPSVRACAYDGCESGPRDAKTVVYFKSPVAFAQIMRAPRGLGLARAWLTGQIDVEGDLHMLVERESALRDPATIAAVAFATLRIAPTLRYRDFKAAGPTSIEYRGLHPGLHSIASDIRETDYHYGLSADFYRRLLGPSLTYSGGIFLSEFDSLENAQDRKHDMICQKLQLNEGSVILDIGCGWGSFLAYARKQYGCKGIGITASRAQYEEAKRRVVTPLRPVTEILCGDYRQILPVSRATAAASIGMYEHVGERNSAKFFSLIRRCVPTGSYYLNQSMVSHEGSPRRFRENSFVQRYIFPNGQILPLPKQLRDFERSGFRVLSVETFGESYAATIAQWLRNLELNWEACVALEGKPRVRAWQIYLTGSLTRFENRSIDLAQVLVEAR